MRVVIPIVCTRIVIRIVRVGLIAAPRAGGRAADIGGRAVGALSHEFVQFVAAVFALNIPAATHAAVVPVGHGEGIVIVGIGAAFPGQQGLRGDF